jgi:hypothetical protein
MPAFNTALPTLPKKFDLRDVVDQIDRKIEVAEQAVALAQQQLQGIQINPATGNVWTDDTYPRPAYVTSDANIEAYETDVDAAIAALATARASLQAVALMNASFAAIIASEPI